ncbi:multidrug efflux SMR transporter [Jannaschia sp. W003]|uniref:DMT family transporter n=1 Tax=Jannaschia sp. W003 TaxID=2867012 RepID=UPI0021A49B90|nr:SMR family transporter [Jannaschia sp. W003]UWQ20971.1 QacE family quaternary ammonium compound efflux SMR transporter [Jannaschia sp. W003]
MSWFLLLAAGLLETVWALGLKLLAARFSAVLLVATAAAMLASLALLHAAMGRLPLGVAYPLWTGIGSAGAMIAGWAWLGQPVGPAGVAGLVLMLTGMALVGLDGA